MKNTCIRQPRADEADTLKQIWKTVFDDGDEYGFFDYYFDPELSAVVTQRGFPVAAGYLIPYGSINSGELSVPCAMIYAVATLPEYRNLGYGAAVVNDLLSSAYCLGYPAVAICPSNDGLFEYYSSHTGFCARSYIFYINERTYVNKPAADPAVRLVDISPHDYGLIRKNLLKGVAHIEPNVRALAYQELLCHELGGGLFSVDTPGGIACAVVERQYNGYIWIKEMLVPDGFEHDVTSAVMTAFPAAEYVVRTPSCRLISQLVKQIESNNPAQGDTPGLYHSHVDDTNFGIKRFAMLTGTETLLNDIIASNIPLWFGLAFD